MSLEEMSDDGYANESTRFGIAGEFSLEAPRGSSARLEEGSVFVLRLPTNPESEILISRRGMSGASAMEVALKDAIAFFFRQCLPSGEGSRSPIEPAADAEPGETILQGVAFDQNRLFWFARAIARHGTREYYWFQWCGSDDAVATMVLPVAVSFSMDPLS